MEINISRAIEDYKIITVKYLSKFQCIKWIKKILQPSIWCVFDILSLKFAAQFDTVKRKDICLIFYALSLRIKANLIELSLPVLFSDRRYFTISAIT